MMLSPLDKKKHLLWRAGFGPSLLEISTLDTRALPEIWADLSKKRPFIPLKISGSSADAGMMQSAKPDPAARRQLMKQNRQTIKELNLNFLNEMVSSEDQLREKMAFFWHGHFACRTANAHFSLHLLNTIREKALGSFGDLLTAVSQSPAMLQFLNNQQNKKGHPNENFAREVMELFTMGRGNYTEKDVQEAARAFTGWGFGPDGNFIQKLRQHDFGEKTFLGKTGNFDGDDVLKMILARRATADFLVNKIYRFFVNETINQNIVNDLSEKFYASNYDIGKLMTEIFTAKWFFAEENVGTRIKSPIELMAGMQRVLEIKSQRPENLLVYQKLLGQTLLYPPNVAGWPMGKSWIDSSTLMLRLQLPQIWSGLRPLDLEPKNDDDLEMGQRREMKGFKNPNFAIDWERVEGAFKNKNAADLLLQKTSASAGRMADSFSGGSLRQKIINLMATPEFQLM